MIVAVFPFLWTLWGSFKVQGDFFSKADWENAIYGIRTLAYSDKAQGELAALYEQQPLLELISSPYQRINDAQAVFLISWSPRDRLDIDKINQQAMPVFDAQNTFTRSQIDRLVGDYVGIGRSK